MANLHFILYLVIGLSNANPIPTSYPELKEIKPESELRFGYGMSFCYIVGLGPNCKFIDLLIKRLVITFIKISFLNCFIVSEIIYSQTDTLTEELMYLR